MRSMQSHPGRTGQTVIGLLLALTLLIAGCTVPPPPAAQPGADQTAATAPQTLTANLTDGCVESYAEGVDYFPEKLTVDHSVGFQVAYENNYKVVTVTDPWQGAQESFTYVLVQCGTPAPEGYAPEQIIEIPVRSFVSLSTTYLPHLESFGAVDRLVGMDSFLWTTTESVQERIAAGEVAQVGSGSTVNVELLLDLEPELVMTYAMGFADFDAHPLLLAAGIPVAINGDFVEHDPLGRTEWMKFIALFLNQDGLAQERMAQIAAEYEATAALAATAASQPAVMVGSMYDGTWWMAGQESYTARILADAGAAYLWAGEGGVASMPLDFEVVLDRASDAAFWVNPDNSFWLTPADVVASDERYAEFAPFQTGSLFNNNRIANENGGLGIFESGVANPHLILKDLVHIFHPELLPDHELVYYQPVE